MNNMHEQRGADIEPGPRRHADRTVQLWMQRLKDSSSTKRLSLVYLANGKLLPGLDLLHALLYL